MEQASVHGAIVIIDDTMLAEDDYYWDEDDDIGEYDEQPSTQPVTKPRLLRCATYGLSTASIPQRSCLSVGCHRPCRAPRPSVSRQVAAKKTRGGWDEVDIGELSIQQMDERIELERKQLEAQRLAMSSELEPVEHSSLTRTQ